MPYGQNTPAIRLIVALTLLFTLPAGILLAADDEDLTAAKDEFNMLWHAAAETTKKRSALEQNLAQFDSRVANARRALASAAEQRKAVREDIAERKELIEALRGQILAAQQSQGFYETVALGQKDDFAEFVRYMVSRNIADRESGPASASPLLRRILRGSLGDSIQDQLARQAVLEARQRFFDQVRVLVLESERVEQRLHASATALTSELLKLEEQQSAISSDIDEKAAFIDNSWREKKLTEAELADVAQESAEVSARIADMQVGLVRINEELKEGRLKELNAQRDALQQKLSEAESRRDAVKMKDQALALLEENALKAFQSAMQAKGSDKKLYQRIEDIKRERTNASEELQSLKNQLSGTGSSSEMKQISSLTAKIAHFDALLSYMKDGVPKEEAEKYVNARRQADDAKPVRATYAAQIVILNAEVAGALKDVSAKIAQIEDIAKQYELTGLPPVFVWPVKGTMTAGYFDPSYETVFRVPHRGIDIAVPQATPVRSISDGIVFAVKDGGARGFSYILIAHKNGYASLYGHMSSMFVNKGAIVNAGQIIGLSGGTPGTHGAGPMTTGAHVHLEVTKDGVHVNPMSVLP